MKFVIDCISDTHNQHHLLEFTRPECDRWILVHSGDFSSFGKYHEVRNFATWCTMQDHDYKVVIAGNHELMMDQKHWKENPGDLAVLQAKGLDVTSNTILTNAGVIWLNQSSIDLEGLKIWGSPYSPRFFDWGFQLDSQNAYDHWSQIPQGTHIVLSHGPPRGYGDECLDINDKRKKVNVGCPELTKRLRKVKPLLTVFGHVHEGNGVYNDNITNCLYVNAAVLDGQYRFRKESIRLTINNFNISKIDSIYH